MSVCGLVANDFERATSLGEAEVAELVRRYGEGMRGSAAVGAKK